MAVGSQQMSNKLHRSCASQMMKISLCIIVVCCMFLVYSYYYSSPLVARIPWLMKNGVLKDTKLATNGYLSHQPKDIAPCGERYLHYIRGKRGFVIGTIKPWFEGMLLGFGARNITTLEYAHLVFESSEIEAYNPYDFADKWMKGEIKPYVFGVTFSSIEHSGLGRYTDPLNPYGDLESMAQSWCMVKPGGMSAVGVEDSLNSNNSIV
ncbi:hypothetical protein LSH36_68g16009 [Paralvinella palmiformis]|uniref:Uncharacterized protein n=1 Tax=Paralvinella palmiformis TaxID=53620 RepID=A0AAD9NEF5_9ANNE|nr:hypothetical protein LSH36_68g16009 [Paralvinella palmiformis]